MAELSLHAWTLNPDEAIQLQEIFGKYLVLAWDGRVVNTIGGVDIKYTGDVACVVITVYTYPDMLQLDSVAFNAPLHHPYVPGLLAFRVGPAILVAWERLTLKPDLLMLHGHGTAHPRGFGLASHIGLWLDLPTVGIAKTCLYGTYSKVGSQVGDWSEILDEKDSTHMIGAVLRTRVITRPVFVSPGHLIDLHHSIQFVLACCRGFRIPEPIRAAHQKATNACVMS